MIEDGRIVWLVEIDDRRPDRCWLQIGRRVAADGIDGEGFSAGSHQFDSDITIGRHQRAARNLAGKRLFAVACEARSANDASLTLIEVAEATISLGARAAINLDGGGSTSLVVGMRLVNRPRDGARNQDRRWAADRDSDQPPPAARLTLQVFVSDGCE